MDQYIASQGGHTLNIEAKYYNKLDIEAFSQMMKDPSYCYKFYWLEAVVHIISEGKMETTFDEIIDEMIANASKVEIKNAIHEHQSELKKFKEQLTNMVPYRALAGFFSRSEEAADWNSVKRITEYIRRVNEVVTPLPYTLGDSSKLKKEVHFHPDWVAMIQDNTVNILGWIQYEKVKWLQNNNPEVPGLHKRFEACYRDNLHSIWAGQELYRKGNSRPQTREAETNEEISGCDIMRQHTV